MRRIVSRISLVAAFVLVASLAYFAGRRAVDTAPAQPAAAEPTTITVETGELVEQRRMTVRLQWKVSSPLFNQLAGTVTRLEVVPGATSVVAAGDVVFSVDEIPVIVLPGDIPAYRDLGPGSTGTDVAQLQEFLKEAGTYAAEVDGRWTAATTLALRDWQEAAGLPASRSLQRGSVWFVPGLPVTLGWSTELQLGAPLASSAPVADILPSMPSADLILPPEFADSLEAAVTAVTIDDETVELLATGEYGVDETGQQLASLRLANVDPACGWCDSVPIGTPAEFPAVVTIAGPIAGTLVPVGVLSSSADEAFVTTADGQRQQVEVLIQVDGQAIVAGVEPGATILVP